MSQEYPEHEKLQLIKDKSQTCGEFLDWLTTEKHVVLSTRHHHDEDCFYKSKWKMNCGLQEGDLIPFRGNNIDLLAEFFHIDTRKLEVEKEAMLEAHRRLMAGASNLT